MAITVRRMVEEVPEFMDPKIDIAYSTNVPAKSTRALTTIQSLYGILRILFMGIRRVRRNTLRFNRPSDEVLEEYFHLALEYFDHLRRWFPELDAFFSTEGFDVEKKRLRGTFGGHILFRPAGLEILTDSIISLTRAGYDLSDAVQIVAKLPTDLERVPYRGLIWNPTKQGMVLPNKGTAKQVVKFMIGTNNRTRELKEKYLRSLVGLDEGEIVNLPKPVHRIDA